ncbi:NAD(P)-binding domain-containing protein, partial [Streptomyces sp. NPDC047072]|uniref:NAD(P)-binding domain-containing protein n=1 Tax=Streptomyces sp. NPDC047072 TaxID=3154809 RepID=UPI003400A435
MSPHPRPRTAVIGLGAMGLPMARRLAGQLPLSVYDIAADRRAALAASEGAAAPSRSVRRGVAGAAGGALLGACSEVVGEHHDHEGELRPADHRPGDRAE